MNLMLRHDHALASKMASAEARGTSGSKLILFIIFFYKIYFIAILTDCYEI